jgi:hypothetical protein
MNTITCEQLKALYRRSQRDFNEDISAALQDDKSFIFSGPDYFLMGRSVDDHGWHIVVAVGIGRMQKFLELMPYELPYIGFSRDPSGHGEITWYSINIIRRLI